ncbi:MAG TPA: hypothetical protein VFO55_10430 [Gemmatimonadaceae bacterium]|nr:hypothetical protein [Gemmatimonadaceae bacterium]
MNSGKVLILSPHVMTAALVGWYVELAKLEPAFAAPGERPEDALSRVKPLLVVLVDVECEEAISDLFVARALKREVGLAMFSGSSEETAAREWARRHELPFFRLPVDLESFGRVLDQAARLGREERRLADRREGPALDRAVDGTLLLVDEQGRSWYVYDRRASERRGQPIAHPYRAFVSAEGVERRAPLSEAEFSARGARDLLAQLARADQAPTSS